jgi:hypothetical protein
MSQADPTGFGKFVPGFEFLQNLAKGDGNASLASWVAPSLDAEALDKRIEELKAVQFWLDQNAAALKATIQALEVQKMTLATLRSMNVPMPGTPGMPWPSAAAQAGSAASTDAAPAGKAPRKTAAGKPAPAATGPAPSAGEATPDPMQFWGALTRQFQQIAADTMKDVATRAAAAPAGVAAAKTAAADKPAARPSRAAKKPAGRSR